MLNKKKPFDSKIFLSCTDYKYTFNTDKSMAYLPTHPISGGDTREFHPCVGTRCVHKRPNISLSPTRFHPRFFHRFVS